MKYISRNKTLSFSLLSGVLAILLQIFRWDLFDKVSFIIILIEFAVLCLFITSITFSVALAVRRRKRPNIYTLLPLLLNGITIIIIIYIPFTKIIVYTDFILNKKTREEVVRLIKSGSLRPNISYRADLLLLPDKFRRLSKGGGEVLVRNDQSSTGIFFFTFRGILDNFSGFAFCPVRSTICIDKFVYRNDVLQVERMDDHWYWIASH